MKKRERMERKMSRGWIKVHRKLLENPIACKDGEHLAVWIYLLLEATHQDRERLFKGEVITLKPGQLITGRKKISDALRISESKIQRVLSSFESCGQIEQQMSSQNRLITIVRWKDYQGDELRLDGGRTACEPPVNTIQKCKNAETEKIGKFGGPDRKNTRPYGRLVNVMLTEAEYLEITGVYEQPKALIDKVSLWLPEHPQVRNHFAKVLLFAQNDSWPRRRTGTEPAEPSATKLRRFFPQIGQN